MERAPEDAALGALGLAGICRETLRVIRSYPPGSSFLFGTVITFSLSLLAHVAVSRVLFRDAFASSDAGAGFVRLAANWALFLLAEAAFLCIIVFHSLVSAVFCAFSVAPRYSSSAADADRDARAVQRDLRQVPRFFAKFLVSVFRGDSRLAARLVRTGPAVFVRAAASSFDALLILFGYTVFSASAAAAAAWVMHLPRAVLLLVGGTAYLAGVVYIAAVWRVASVLSMLEDGDRNFDAMHLSDGLLTGAGKFWTAQAVFATLDGYSVAVQLAFGVLVVENWMSLGVWLRVAMGTVIAAALWAALVAGLVAQVVVYFVCKSYRRRCESSEGAAAKSLTDVGRKGRATRNRK